MSAQDILPDVEKRQSYHLQRRVLFATALILVGYLATTRFIEASIRLVGGRSPNGWEQQASSLSRPQSAHLIKLVDQRRSNYHPGSALLGVTAIITVTLQKQQQERTGGGVQLLLRFLTKYPFVKEIIIWNDDVMSSGYNMNGEDLLARLNSTDDRAPLPILRVINSPGRMGEISGHMACSLAKFNTCYHTDENIMNLNLDTLYTKYLESDSESEASIVDHASPEEYMAESAYNVWQPDYSLNTGVVSQLSRGSLAAKRLSTRYFQQLTTALRSSEESDLWRSIPRSVSNDIQFSIWSNRRPLKLITPLQSSLIADSPAKISFLDPQFIDHAYERLNRTIQSSDPFLVPNMFPRALSSHHSKPESEIGVASAYDDRSMLITNLNFSRQWPLAIDGELSTCWKDLPALEHGSFVGLNFVRNVHLNQLTFFGKIEPENWKLELLSANNQKWNTEPVIPRIITHQEPPLTKFVYDLSASSTLVKKIRLIIPQGKSSPDGITVCGWMVNEDWVV